MPRAYQSDNTVLGRMEEKQGEGRRREGRREGRTQGGKDSRARGVGVHNVIVRSWA